MLINQFLQLALLIVANLGGFVAAGADPAPAYGSAIQQLPLNPPSAVANESSTIERELLLEECDPTISVCGTTADIKVVRTHKSTEYVTSTHVHEVITELPTSYRTVWEVIVSTNTTGVEGQCRDTIIYEETTPTTVFVEINTTTTREVVPIVPVTSKTVSWVSHKKISQCIIKRTSTGLAPGPGSSSASTPSSAPSQQPPPAAGSGGNYNSGQPAPNVSSTGASSAQGSGNQSSAPSSSSQSSTSTSESASGGGYGSASGSVSRASGASASSSASGASRASSSTSSSTSRSTP